MAVKDLVGVDFSADRLRIAVIRVTPTKRELINVVTTDIAGMEDGDISKVIRGAVSKFKIRAPQVVNAIPSNMIITKNIEIPSVNPQEIHEIINLQASRYTPYSREEIMVDYIDIDTYKNNYTKILLIIVARSVIKRQFEILERAGMDLNKVILIPETLAWAVPKIARIDTGAHPASIVHIDESTTDFVIVSRNKPTFIRSISIGAQHLLDEKASAVPKFLEEIKKSFEAYQTEDIEKGPNILVLTGAVEGLKDVESTLSNALHLQIKSMDYFKSLAIAKDALDSKTRSGKISFFGIITSLLALNDVKVNLIPEEIRLKKSVEERGKDLIKTGVLLLTVLVLVFSILITKMYFRNIYLQVVKKRHEKVYKEAKKLEGQFERVTRIREYLSKRGHSLEVLAGLHGATPDDMELNDIRFDQAGKFTVKGTATSMSTVFSFVDNMEKSEYFRDVKTRYTTKRRDGRRDVTDFEINCVLDKEMGS